MTALLRYFSFPLLAKELTEAAARRRTYVLRVVYGVLLFAVFAMISPRWLWRGSMDPFSVMGQGRWMFSSLLALQFIGIALFLPAMMCGRIAEEKERDSLVLLFLTDLRPWSIVLQKYLGGLVPMLSFLLLAMPLTAVAYAFGGVTTEALGTGLYALLLACLQVGALALMCSAWCRTTVAALVSTYLLAVAFYLGPICLFALFRIVVFQNLGPSPDDFIFSHVPVMLLEKSGLTPGEVLLRSTSVLLSIVFFLLLARVFLVRRAFAPASTFFVRQFRRLDGVMHLANRLTGHRMLLREGRTLPDDDPIAWREMTRKTLGKIHYLVRILVVIEVPIVGICAFASVDEYIGQSIMLSVTAAIVGTLAVLALSVQAANTIVSERVQQTLEVLLTTPLTAREIVVQKARVLRRFMFVLAIPLLTIFGSESCLEWDLRARYGERDGPVVYLVCVLLTVGIYLPLVSWLSLWIGLKMRTRFKAILTALAVVVAWCVLPIVCAAFVENLGLFGYGFRGKMVGVLLLLSPLAVPAANELSSLHQVEGFRNTPGIAWIIVAGSFTFYGALLFLIRRRALARADRYLRPEAHGKREPSETFEY
ncbi:MAG: ABC transporter permease [Chthoniobacter sp.]|nr:ABC transporter permease [Chthoniobacter sp.]